MTSEIGIFVTRGQYFTNGIALNLLRVIMRVSLFSELMINCQRFSFDKHKYDSFIIKSFHQLWTLLTTFDANVY